MGLQQKNHGKETTLPGCRAHRGRRQEGHHLRPWKGGFEDLGCLVKTGDFLVIKTGGFS